MNPVIYTGLDPRVQLKVKRIAFLSNADPRMVFESVQEVFDVTYDELIGRHRKQEKAFARHATCYVFKKVTKYSLEEIGDYLGGRDHSTITHSIKAARNLIDTDKFYKDKVFKAVDIFKKRRLGIYQEDRE